MMNENEMKHWLKPIHNSIEKLVPTNRSLIDFVNEKAQGDGIKRSLYKVKFIDKSERSTYTCITMTINELKKKLKESNINEEEADVIIDQAKGILKEAKEAVEKVYGEVRRYVVTSELRTGCVQHHYRKIPGMSDAQNSAISKEIFSMALEVVNKGDKHSIDDIEDEFNKINDIALNLFDIVAKTGGTETQKKKTAKPQQSKSYSPFSLLEDLF